MKYLKLFCVALALIFISAKHSLQAAPILQLGEKGVTIENGGLKCSLAFPTPINAAKAKAKILEKTASETGVTLKYEGGGQIDLGIHEGEIALKLSGMPEDTKTLYFTMRMPTSAATNGKWQFDGKSGVFPAEDAGVNIHQGTAKSLSLTPASDQGIALSLPATAFQQLQDLRQFQRKEFYWQCWLPVSAGTETLSIKVSDTTGAAAANALASASTAGASKPAPKPEAKKPQSLDRQKFGQTGISPKDKKTGTRILRFQDGKQAAYMLGFDDSLPKHLALVIPELEKRKMVGNFYVNPGSPNWKKHKAEWEVAARSPYVALHNHTWTHTGVQTVDGFEDDLLKTNDAIYAITPHLKTPRLMVFRQPGGCPWKITKKETSDVLAKHHMVSRPWLDGPPLTMKGGLPEVLSTVDTALSRGELGFVDFHGVGGDGLPAPMEWFVALLDKLDAERDRLWITDAASWAKYQAERKNAEIKVLQADASQLRASLTCSSDPVYYDMPLTVAIEVPAIWKTCNVVQGTKTWQATAEGGEIRFDALPGSDEIVIKPQ